MYMYVKRRGTQPLLYQYMSMLTTITKMDTSTRKHHTPNLIYIFCFYKTKHMLSFAIFAQQSTTQANQLFKSCLRYTWSTNIKFERSLKSIVVGGTTGANLRTSNWSYCTTKRPNGEYRHSCYLVIEPMTWNNWRTTTSCTKAWVSSLREHQASDTKPRLIRLQQMVSTLKHFHKGWMNEWMDLYGLCL